MITYLIKSKVNCSTGSLLDTLLFIDIKQEIYITHQHHSSVFFDSRRGFENYNLFNPYIDVLKFIRGRVKAMENHEPNIKHCP